MTVGDLISRWVSHWLLITLCTFVGVAAGVGVTAVTAEMFEAETVLDVNTLAKSKDVPSLYQGELLAQERVKSYPAVITSTPVLTEVAGIVRGSDSVEQLRDRIAVTIPAETSLLQISAQAPRSSDAAELAAAVATAAAERIAELETQPGRGQTTTVSVVEPPVTPDAPASPNIKINVALGGIVGLVTGLTVAAVLRPRRLRRRGRRRRQTLAGLEETPLGGLGRSARADDVTRLRLSRDLG